MPAAYTQRGYVAAGGLMSYGTDQLRHVSSGRRLHRPHSQRGKAHRSASVAVDKLEFVINIQTARALGIEVPPSVLSIANELIE